MNAPVLKNIVCIDDERDILEVVTFALNRLGGFDVAPFSRGKDALAHVETFPPDAILLDVMMPEMDGPTLLRKFREMPALAGVPVIFMTAKIQPPEVAYYLSLGAAGVIPKPFDPMTLPKQVNDFWKLFHTRR